VPHVENVLLSGDSGGDVELHLDLLQAKNEPVVE